MVPYAHKGNGWIGFDNVRSITIKVSYYPVFSLLGIFSQMQYIFGCRVRCLAI